MSTVVDLGVHAFRPAVNNALLLRGDVAVAVAVAVAIGFSVGVSVGSRGLDVVFGVPLALCSGAAAGRPCAAPGLCRGIGLLGSDAAAGDAATGGFDITGAVNLSNRENSISN